MSTEAKTASTSCFSQTRCYRINVKLQGQLDQSAIIVAAGPGKEDRLHHGSYVQLREQERRVQAPPSGSDAESYLPVFLK